MAEDDLELDEQETEAKEPAKPEAAGKFGRMKTILIGAAVVGLLASNAFFLIRFMASEPRAAAAGEGVPEEVDETEEVDAIAGADLLESGSVLRFEPLLVNLADKEAHRLVRARVELVFATQEEMERVQESQFAIAKVQDVALSLLATKRSSELRESDGRSRFREELARELEKNLEGVKIVDVLLTDFIIQY